MGKLLVKVKNCKVEWSIKAEMLYRQNVNAETLNEQLFNRQCRPIFRPKSLENAMA